MTVGRAGRGSSAPHRELRKDQTALASLLSGPAVENRQAAIPFYRHATELEPEFSEGAPGAHTQDIQSDFLFAIFYGAGLPLPGLAGAAEDVYSVEEFSCFDSV